MFSVVYLFVSFRFRVVFVSLLVVAGLLLALFVWEMEELGLLSHTT